MYKVPFFLKKNKTQTIFTRVSKQKEMEGYTPTRNYCFCLSDGVKNDHLLAY